MTPWSWYLLIAGVLLYTTGVVALVAWAAGDLARRRARRALRRAEHAERELRRLRHRYVRHLATQHPPQLDPVTVLPGLWDQVDQMLSGTEADTVITGALTPTAAELYEQLRRQP